MVRVQKQGMDRGEIVQLLQDMNQQWQENTVDFAEDIIVRDALSTLQERNGVQAVVGLRRVGKTTLLRQFLREWAAEHGYDRTCYFSFDLDVTVKDVVEAFCEDVLREPVSDLDRPVHLFLDEVQNREDWSNHVKHFYDNYDNIAFTVTGSSAANIQKGAGESLAGRLSVLRLYPFSFRAYLRYHGITKEKTPLDEFRPADRETRIRFTEYMEAGGMPELYRHSRPIERLEETLDLVFFRDIVEMFNASRPAVLDGMFRFLAANTGQVVNYNTLTDALDADFRTVKTYLDYLEDSFLIDRSKPYTGSAAASIRKNPKVYIADHAYNRIHDPGDGLIAETIAYNHLKRLEQPYYMKQPETDIVLPDRELLFEVKYRETIRDGDLEPLVENAQQTGFQPVLVSKHTYDTRTINGHDVQLVPLHVLCLAI